MKPEDWDRPPTGAKWSLVDVVFFSSFFSSFFWFPFKPHKARPRPPKWARFSRTGAMKAIDLARQLSVGFKGSIF